MIYLQCPTKKQTRSQQLPVKYRQTVISKPVNDKSLGHVGTNNSPNLTSKNNFICEDRPWLLFLAKLKMSSSRPMDANASVATVAPETSMEEKPAVNFATPTPIGITNKPPIVGVALFLKCLTGAFFLTFRRIFSALRNGTKR